MDSGGRASVARLIAGRSDTTGRRPVLPATLRPVVIGLLTDRSAHVRGIAIEALTKTRLDPAEAPAIEALLTRAASDLRRGALTMLASLPRADARDSAARLAASKDKRQREAAAELRRVIDVESAAAAGQQASAAAPAGDVRAAFTAGRTPPAPPRTSVRGPRPDKRTARTLQEIDEIAARHRDVTVTLTNWQGQRGDALRRRQALPFALRPPGLRPGLAGACGGHRRPAGARRGVPRLVGERPDALRGPDAARDALRCYALATFLPENRPAGLPAGSLVAALAARVPGAQTGKGDWWRNLLLQLAGDPPGGLGHPSAVRHVTSWLAVEHANGLVVDECLDALEATLAAVPRRVLTEAVDGRSLRVLAPYSAGRLA